MQFRRFSIAGLMGVVLTTALGLTALRSVSETSAGITLLVTCAVLALAVIGAICRSGGERAWWLGFAAFGWGYLALAFWSPSRETTLPTITGLMAIYDRVGLNVPTVRSGLGPGTMIDPSFIRIGHFVLALVAASVGSTFAAVFFGTRGFRSAVQWDDRGQRSCVTFRRIWQHQPTKIALSGLALAVMVTVIGSLWSPPFWAGLAFLTTCVLLALVILGAIVGRGRARQMWLGAALFGWGYMVLAFGWHPFHSACPYLVTGRWLDGLRPSLPPKLSGFPPCDDRTDPANARILAALEQPIPMHFREATPLEDLLRYVQSATAGPDGKAIVRYSVDPIGLQEAEQTMLSTFQIYAEKVPLKATLAICLRQLDLTYVVKDGFLMISSKSETDAEILPISENPLIVVGHSLIALVAAAFGAAVAPFVAGRNEGRVSSGSDEEGHIARPGS